MAYGYKKEIWQNYEEIYVNCKLGWRSRNKIFITSTEM